MVACLAPGVTKSTRVVVWTDAAAGRGESPKALGSQRVNGDKRAASTAAGMRRGGARGERRGAWERARGGGTEARQPSGAGRNGPGGSRMPHLASENEECHMCNGGNHNWRQESSGRARPKSRARTIAGSLQNGCSRHGFGRQLCYRLDLQRCLQVSSWSWPSSAGTAPDLEI